MCGIFFNDRPVYHYLLNRIGWHGVKVGPESRDLGTLAPGTPLQSLKVGPGTLPQSLKVGPQDLLQNLKVGPQDPLQSLKVGPS